MRQLLANHATTAICLWFLALGCIQPHKLKAGSGGPDLFGYRWIDSNEPNGPQFNWLDLPNISGAVQVQSLGDEGFRGPFALGWPFRFYWFDFQDLYIGANGYLSFEAIPPVGWCFPMMGNASDSRYNLIAPYQTDLNLSGPGNPAQVWFWSNGQDSAVVSYLDIPNWRFAAPNYHGSNNFQVILNGQDSSITFQYLSLTDTTLLLTSQCGQDLEIGIENPTGIIGLTVLRESAPADSYAVYFDYPFPQTLQIGDARPNWNLNPRDGGIFHYTDTDMGLLTEVGSVGTIDLDSSIFVNGRILAFNGSSQLWTDQEMVNQLPSGNSAAIQFGQPFRYNIPGWYYFETEVTCQQDVNPSNDSRFAEIVLVRPDSNRLRLSFSRRGNPGDFLFWPETGGDNGAAVLIQPPGYPAILREIELYLAGDDGNPNTPLKDGCEIQIWSEDPNGNPQTLLASKTLPPDSIVEDTWNLVSFDNAPQILNRGFFVMVILEGENIGLGLETIGPKSKRNYELIGGILAPFRLNATRDLQIAAILDADSIVGRKSAPPITAARIKASPNPAQDLLRLSFTQIPHREGTLRLLDLEGNCKAQCKLHPRQCEQAQTFDISHLPCGLYFAVWESSNGRYATKVSIQR